MTTSAGINRFLVAAMLVAPFVAGAAAQQVADDLPVIRWLKQSKNRSVQISLEASPEPAVTAPR
jgi:hypothetical protein